MTISCCWPKVVCIITPLHLRYKISCTQALENAQPEPLEPLLILCSYFLSTHACNTTYSSVIVYQEAKQRSSLFTMHCPRAHSRIHIPISVVKVIHLHIQWWCIILNPSGKKVPKTTNNSSHLLSFELLGVLLGSELLWTWVCVSSVSTWTVAT